MPVSPFRLAIATYAACPALHEDDRLLLPALAAEGIAAQPCVWSAADVDWSAFDAVLLRSTWDYFERYTDFCRWLDALPVPTINPKPLARWNSDKRYLADLEARGVATVPTRYCHGGALAAEFSGQDRRELVVKPRVSGGAWHTVRGVVGDPAFAAAIAGLPRDFEFMVQPFLPEIASAGEWSLLYFGGAFSHAVLKRPATGDYRVQLQFGGSAVASDPPIELLDAAQRAVDAAAATCFGPIDYARVDGVVVDGRFVLMELELIEPYLHLGAHAPAAARLAHVLRARLEAQGRTVGETAIAGA
jgi:glutathione synthase/RimK-type ligase-like ATP-grasp enzyme